MNAPIDYGGILHGLALGHILFFTIVLCVAWAMANIRAENNREGDK